VCAFLPIIYLPALWSQFCINMRPHVWLISILQETVGTFGMLSIFSALSLHKFCWEGLSLSGPWLHLSIVIGLSLQLFLALILLLHLVVLSNFWFAQYTWTLVALYNKHYMSDTTGHRLWLWSEQIFPDWHKEHKKTHSFSYFSGALLQSPMITKFTPQFIKT
jgi:hypothetical protein